MTPLIGGYAWQEQWHIYTQITEDLALVAN